MSSPSLASEQVTFGVNLLPIGSGAGAGAEVRGEARNLGDKKMVAEFQRFYRKQVKEPKIKRQDKFWTE